MKLVVEKVLNSVIVYTPVYCLSSNFSFKKKTLSLPSPTSTCFVSLPHVSLPSFLPFIVKMCSGCGNYCSPKWMLIESSFNLLTEFFFFFSEELLNNFSQTQDSWKHCLFFMANTQNEYVMMFCLTVLEVSKLMMPSSQQLKGCSPAKKNIMDAF